MAASRSGARRMCTTSSCKSSSCLASSTKQMTRSSAANQWVVDVSLRNGIRTYERLHEDARARREVTREDLRTHLLKDGIHDARVANQEVRLLDDVLERGPHLPEDVAKIGEREPDLLFQICGDGTRRSIEADHP